MSSLDDELNQMSPQQLQAIASGQELSGGGGGQGGFVPNMENRGHGGIMGAIHDKGQDMFNWLDSHPMVRRGAMGAAVAAGSLAGAPVTLPALGMAALSGGLGAAAPPENGTDAALMGVGEFSRGLRMAEAIENPIARMLAKIGITKANPAMARVMSQGAVGAGMEGVNGVVRSATGNGSTDPKSMAVAAGLPMLAGGVGEAMAGTRKATALRQGIQETVDSLAGQHTPIGQPTPNELSLDPRTQASLKAAGEQASQQVNAQKSAPAVQQRLADLKAQNLDLLTNASGPGDPVAYAKNQRELINLAKSQSTQGIAPPSPEDDQISKLNDSISTINTQRDNQLIRPSDATAQTAAIQKQITGLQQQKWANTAQQFQQASWEKSLNGIINNVQEMKTTQGTLDALQTEIDTNPLENVMLKNLVTNSDATKPMTPETLLNNIKNSDAPTVNALYQYLGKQKDGDAQIKNIQNIVINRFMADAYDPQTKSWSKANQLMAADGPFNKDKMEAVFGGGREGQDAAATAVQTIGDLRRLTEAHAGIAGQQAAAAGKSTPSMMTKVFAAPAGAVIGGMFGHGAIGHAAGSLVGEAATMGVLYTPKLIQAAIANPKFAQAFHAWASAGGTNVPSTIITNFVRQNAPRLTDAAPPPPPQPSTQGQGQQPPTQQAPQQPPNPYMPQMPPAQPQAQGPPQQ